MNLLCTNPEELFFFIMYQSSHCDIISIFSLGSTVWIISEFVFGLLKIAASVFEIPIFLFEYAVNGIPKNSVSDITIAAGMFSVFFNTQSKLLLHEKLNLMATVGTLDKLLLL